MFISAETRLDSRKKFNYTDVPTGELYLSIKSTLLRAVVCLFCNKMLPRSARRIYVILLVAAAAAAPANTYSIPVH